MARMSDCAQDLESIHNILLGQRQVASNALIKLVNRGSHNQHEYDQLNRKIDVIDDLMLEFEAAGVVWPGNVVSLEERITAHVGPPKDTVTSPRRCNWPNDCGCNACGWGNRPTKTPEDGA